MSATKSRLQFSSVQFSHSVMSNSLRPHGLYSPWNSPGQNAGVGSLSLLQGIFQTQELNPGLLHCRWILYQLTYQFSSVQSLSRVRLSATPWTAACQASLSITNSRSLLKFMSIESVMPPNHLIFCCPLLLPPSIFPSIRVFSNESPGLGDTIPLPVSHHKRGQKQHFSCFSLSLSHTHIFNFESIITSSNKGLSGF